MPQQPAVWREHRPVSRVAGVCGHCSWCRPSSSVQSPGPSHSALSWMPEVEPAGICSSHFPWTEDRVAAGSFTAPGRRSREMTDEQELATKEGRNPCQPTQRERSLKGSWRRTNGSRKRNSGTKAGAFLN